MADQIVFRLNEIETIANKIDGYANEYRQAAEVFLAAVDLATASWEGATKDKFAALISGSVYNHIYNSIPQLITGLATLLRANAQTMDEVDQKLADCIPDTL